MNKMKILNLRKIIELSSKSLSDEIALTAIELFPIWKPNYHYNINDRVQYNQILYKVLQEHDSQDSWTPDNSPSLFTRVLIIEDQILEWQQPKSTNPYMKGDKVLHNNSTWISDIDNNVWEPGVYGWSIEGGN
jgi:hypothetical protein